MRGIVQTIKQTVTSVVLNGDLKKMVNEPSERYNVRRKFSSSIPLRINPSNKGAKGKPADRSMNAARPIPSIRKMSNGFMVVRYTPSMENAMTKGISIFREI